MFRRLALILPFFVAACSHHGSAPDAGDDQPIDGAPHDSADVDAAAPDGSVETGVVQCPTPLPAPTDGDCDVADGTGTAVVVSGNILGNGVTYLDGAVVYDNDLITYVGCDPSGAPGYATATKITCGGAAVSPGLINAHDHITFDEHIPTVDGTKFLNRNQWRAHYPTPPNVDGADGTRWTEIRQVMSGTTSNNGSGGAAGMERNLDSLETRDFDLGFENVRYETFILNDQSVTNAPANCGWNYEYTEADVAVLHDLFNHAGEGLDLRAHEEFRCVESNQAGARDFVESNTAHVHIIGGNAADFYNMAHDHTSLVWSPRSNLSLFGNTTPAQEMAAVGGNVAIGTDWSYSGSATMLRELACVDSWNSTYLNGYFSDEDMWKMATINAAKAVGSGDLTGSLEVGKVADIAVFHADAGETYRAIIDSTDADVDLVIRAGDVLYGEDDVVNALDPSCELLTAAVCGNTRRLCATREIGETYETLQGQLDGSELGAEFCGAPTPEPTCVPARPTEYDGTPTASDNDGDGIANASDDCPDVFNPIRSIDNGVQSDVDGDGVGDACDPTPVGTDLDGDGVLNNADDCPLLADPDQTDVDGDGKGAACESCDDVSNALLGCPPSETSIVSIQNGTVTTGTVFVQGTVTGVAYNGFTIQDPTVADGQYAGIFVFGPTNVTVGETAQVSGGVTEYFGMTEISPGTLVSHTPGGTMPAPVALTAAQAATEPYEGVLVKITDISSVTNPYTCTCGSDTNMFKVNNAVVGWDAMYPGTDPQWQTAIGGMGADLIGVMFYRYNEPRILPRSDADF